jgi:hypothetical protein
MIRQMIRHSTDPPVGRSLRGSVGRVIAHLWWESRWTIPALVLVMAGSVVTWLIVGFPPVPGIVITGR